MHSVGCVIYENMRTYTGFVFRNLRSRSRKGYLRVVGKPLSKYKEKVHYFLDLSIYNLFWVVLRETKITQTSVFDIVA